METLKLPGTRGAQNIITAFFLVVVFVTVLLLLIYFNYEGVVKRQKLSEAPYFLQNSSLLKDRIENCLLVPEKRELKELIPDLNKCMPREAKGYFIERLQAGDCTYSRIEFGEFDECKHFLVYYLNLPEDNTKICLARLSICLGES